MTLVPFTMYTQGWQGLSEELSNETGNSLLRVRNLGRNIRVASRLSTASTQLI